MSRSGRAPKPPGIGAISALAAVVVLVPGILVYAALRGLGLGIGPAGLLGLLGMILGMIAYPLLLRRTGWVGPPRRPATPAASDPRSAHPMGADPLVVDPMVADPNETERP
jgi:hypothetical protein